MLRSLFISLSQNKTLRSAFENSSLGRRLSGRFVPGMDLKDAIDACRRLNGEGTQVSLDYLGESVLTEQHARASGEAYHRILDAIARENLDANVSLKLTQMGIDISPDLAGEIVGALVEKAARHRNFIRIDMEGTPYTEATLQLTEGLHARRGCADAVGTVLQAYLYRTEADTHRLLDQKIRIRLCKGAYNEEASHAFPNKADVDKNYVKLMELMLLSNVFCGIATHDEAMIAATKRFAEEPGIGRDAFEFQMLYGIRRDLQRQLVKEGYRMRVYLPFGTEWYPYFMRRLAERPANAVFLLKNLLRAWF